MRRSCSDLAGWKNPEQAAKDVVAFETKIAEASWTKAEQRDPVAIYNPMTIAELNAFAPGFAWQGFLKQAQLGDLKRIIVAEKSAFPKLAAIYAQTPVETLKAWQAMHIADNAAFYLSKPVRRCVFRHAQQDAVRPAGAGGALEARRACGIGRRLLASAIVSTRFGNLGWAVGQLYTAKYFPPQSKAKIEELVANLKAAYHARIEKLDWMSAADQAAKR